ncbi:hypothetical protein FS749_007235 [Ceratobasidium sp. UAMH 11750]|nr:hypothetical protein FS749_007235 [Ceratobasidium sp. UAMH 11750]
MVPVHEEARASNTDPARDQESEGFDEDDLEVLRMQSTRQSRGAGGSGAAMPPQQAQPRKRAKK